MRIRKVVLPSLFASVHARPFESLEKWMLAKVETRVGLVSEEVKDEICGMWILMFRSKEALKTALCVLIADGGVLADICFFYDKVLSEIEIEIEVERWSDEDK